MTRERYSPATALCLLGGVLALIAAFWLAVTGDWAEAAGAVFVVALCVGTLVHIGDRAAPPGDSANTAPWSATDDPGDEKSLKDLSGSEIDELRAYYAAQDAVAPFPTLALVPIRLPVSVTQAARIREAFLLKYGDRKLPSRVYRPHEPYQGEDGS